jgi:hypothetical protein
VSAELDEGAPDPSVTTPPKRRTLTQRDIRARANIDISRGRGLEVAPLHAPMISRDEADVRYVDILSAQGLRDHYRDDIAVPLDDIVDVDYVLLEGGSARRLSEAVAAGVPFDWVIASHVIEHIPDLIGWLGELAEVMSDGARVSLIVPDGRFCFDVLRPITTVGEMMLAHANGDISPSLRAVFDYHDAHRTVGSQELWAGFVPGDDRRLFSTETVEEMLACTSSGQYIDSHVWVFTPVDFADQFATLSRFGVLDFAFVNFVPTAPDELEFFVTLERFPRSLTADEKRERFQSNFAEIASRAASGESAQTDAKTAASQFVESDFVASDREQKFILMKRRIVNRVRGIRHR